MGGSRIARGVRATLVALGCVGLAAATAPAGGTGDYGSVQLLDVPYVPQSGELCGGAALAMVLRFWGETGVHAEDFAPLVEAGQGGIRTRALGDAVTARGWAGFPLAGKAAVVEQLAQGRPVLALLEVGADAYHYVVLVGWARGWVVLHDPKARPFRAVPEGRFEAAWEASGNWALLVLPPQPGAVPPPTEPASDAGLAPDEAGVGVERGLLLFGQGDIAGAEREFLAAHARDPSSAAPLRELAGLRFHQGDLVEAARCAQLALALDPGDEHSWRLLAASRFLDDDVEGALGAWNELSEPRIDLLRVDGLSRTRHAAVAAQVELTPGQLLTSRDFLRARRRLAELPAQDGFRLGLRPRAGGIAQVDVALVERPLVASGPWDLARAGIRALTEHELAIDVSSPTGNGELWTARWRWSRERPRASIALAAPAAGGRPGIWSVEASRERQGYLAGPAARPAAGPGDVVHEERRRIALSFADWFSPAFRLGAGVAMDEWDQRGARLALGASARARWSRDRWSAALEAERWMGRGNDAPILAAALALAWDPSPPLARWTWLGRAGLSRASASAPRALWSGAGTGSGRAPLLRAHPLLDEGILSGPVFGRTLAHSTLEGQSWPWRYGPLRLGWALFVDSARAWGTGRDEPTSWQVDGGAGLRLQVQGVEGQLRVDLARGLVDGELAGSIAWSNR